MRALLAGLLAVLPGCLITYTVGEAADDAGCPTGQVVCGDECAPSGTCGECPEGQVQCGDECAPADTCACDQGCDEHAETCQAGVCVCRDGLTRCGAACVDPRADPAHCGECDGACGGAADVCQDSVCAAACDPPRRACDGACVDVAVDALHCGACGEACRADEICTAGQCRRYTEIPGCAACPCEDACEADGEDGGEDGGEAGGACCDAPFLGAPVCVEDGCA